DTWITVRLSELLTPARILVPLHATDKEGVLRELVDIAAVGNGGPSDEVLGAILEREKQFPTGIGYGVAVPHGKTPVLSALVVVAGGACSTWGRGCGWAAGCTAVGTSEALCSSTSATERGSSKSQSALGPRRTYGEWLACSPPRPSSRSRAR